MTLELKSLNSRIARRIFLTFITSALVPVIALAVLSLFQVSTQLEAQSREQLHRVAKGHGLSIYEHLLFCEDELRHLDHGTLPDLDRLKEKFSALGRRHPDGRYEPLMGAIIPDIRLTERQIDHLHDGNTLIVADAGAAATVTLVRYVDTGDGAPGLVLGRVRGPYLWGLDNGNLLPPLSEFAVLNAAAEPLYHSLDWGSISTAVRLRMTEKFTRVRVAGTDWFLASWLIFLKPRFGIDNWHLMVLQPEAAVMAPLSRFKLIFVLVVLLALLLVTALSLFSLRRSLEPIEALKTGARCVAQNDFDHRVRVRSRDEFQELAQHFNEMSGHLGQQFRLLSTQEKINHATLMAHNFSHTAGLAISRILKDNAFRMVAIARVNAADPEDELIYLGHAASPDAVKQMPFRIDRPHLRRFVHGPPWLTLTDKTILHHYLPDADSPQIEAATLFPMFVKDRLYALLYVAGIDDLPDSQRDLALMRQIADHLAVAWSNVSLIRDLRRLTTGSMQALARTVDAKSPWTAGHSARVMRIALGIGRHMELDRARMDWLQQAALLHDVGKIGIPAAILDKPGRLTDDEFATIRQHPVIGSNILTPINAFREIVPMVRHHHERWDGKGYPDGLAGEDIVLEARILAVADVFDAMVSDRPYRKGMPVSQAMGIIRTEAGRQFDPKVACVFITLMEQKTVLAA